nr:RecName: Full=Periviscerokinin-2 [Paramantis sacra]
GSSGLIAFPRL